MMDSISTGKERREPESYPATQRKNGGNGLVDLYRFKDRYIFCESS